MPLHIFLLPAEKIYLCNLMAKGLFLGLACFFLFLSQVFIFHKINIRRKFLVITLAFFCGVIIYTVIFLIFPQGFFSGIAPLAVLAFLNGVFLHLFFFYFYIHFIQVIDRSPSTRIMVEIDKSSSGELSLEKIKEIYSIDEKISGELDDLVILGRLIKKGSRYKLTPKGRFHSAVFKTLRDYLHLRRS